MLGLDCFEMEWNVDVYCIVIWLVILPFLITFDYNIKHQDELGRDGLLQDISKMHLETFWFACLSSNNIIASNNIKKCTTLERVEEHLKGKRRALVNCRQGRSRAPALCALHSYSLQPLPLLPGFSLFTVTDRQRSSFSLPTDDTSPVSSGCLSTVTIQTREFIKCPIFTHKSCTVFQRQ